MTLQKTEASTYGKRGRARRVVEMRWLIDGVQVSVLEIAARLGVSDDAARKRLVREQAKPGPVTWLGLGGKA